MNIEKADRLNQLPPYLFAEIDELKQAALARGEDVVDLGIGDPDLPTPSVVIDELHKAATDPENHRYPSSSGMLSFRKSAALWCKRRFGLDLDPASEVLTLIGSKEGIGHLPFALLNPGEVTLVPSPGYPVYKGATILAGGTPYEMPLLEENAYLPDLDNIPSHILEKARLIFLNYPNNPTAATCEVSFFEKVAYFARKHNIIVAHDAAYTEISYDGYKPPSFLEASGAEKVGIEFHSLSKTYNMTGWRIGFAIGNKQVISALAGIKSNLDSGAFQAVQLAGIAALEREESERARLAAVDIYKERRDFTVSELKKIGIDVSPPKAAFYIWFKVPAGETSASFCSRVLEKVSVVITPGTGFGQYGEGYARIALSVNTGRLQEGISRIAGLLS